MRLVIDIPEEEYKQITKWGVSSVEFKSEIDNIIDNGTPLPKGHGRLIDADTLNECEEIMTTVLGEDKYAVRMDEIRAIPTIIEPESEVGECRMKKS